MQRSGSVERSSDCRDLPHVSLFSLSHSKPITSKPVHNDPESQRLPYLESKEHVEDSAVEVFRDRDIDPGCRSKQEDVTAGGEVVQNNIPQAPTTHRPDQ